MSYDRFEMEQKIMAAWQTVDDLRLLANSMYSRALTSSDVSALLTSLATMLDLKMQEAFEEFEKSIKLQSCSAINTAQDVAQFDTMLEDAAPDLEGSFVTQFADTERKVIFKLDGDVIEIGCGMVFNPELNVDERLFWIENDTKALTIKLNEDEDEKLISVFRNAFFGPFGCLIGTSKMLSLKNTFGGEDLEVVSVADQSGFMLRQLLIKTQLECVSISNIKNGLDHSTLSALLWAIEQVLKV